MFTDRVLVQSILDTLSFFRIFSYPLTATETYNCLWQPPVGVTLETVTAALGELVADGVVQELHGLYTLDEITVAAARRRSALWEVEPKLRRAQAVSRWVRFVPFVRAIFLCNTVAFGWPRATSDIDVLIVVRHGHMWLTRVLVTVVVGLLGKRRHGRYVSNRICLSFYIADTALDLTPTLLPGTDIYLTYWITHLHPLFDAGGLVRAFRGANAWVRASLPYAPTNDTMHPDSAVLPTRSSRAVQASLEKLLGGRAGGRLESGARRLQQWKMAHNLHSIQHEPDTRVMISDDIFKFHENDRRAQYRAEWKKWRDEAQARLTVTV